jgi:hypothetical protein
MPTPTPSLRGRPPREFRLIDGAIHYECTVCFAWRPEVCFQETRDPNSRCKRRPACKRCTAAADRKYRQSKRRVT